MPFAVFAFVLHDHRGESTLNPWKSRSDLHVVTLDRRIGSTRAGIGRSGSIFSPVIPKIIKLSTTTCAFRFSAQLESNSNSPLNVTLAAKIANVLLRHNSIAPRNRSFGTTTGTGVQR